MKSKKIFYTILSVSLIFAVYETASLILDNEIILPNLADIVICIKNLLSDSSFRSALYSTFVRCIVSFIFSLIFGLTVGFLCGMYEIVDYLIDPIINTMQSVPVVSIILLAVFWFKTDAIPVFTAILMVMPVMVRAGRAGVKNTDSELLKVADYFGLSTIQKLLFIRIEGARPYIVSCVESSIGIIWKVVAAGEVLVLPKRALGSYLSRSQVILESAELFAVTVIIVFFSYCSLLLAKLAVRFSDILHQKVIDWYFHIEHKKKYLVGNPCMSSDIEVKDFSFLHIFDDFDITINHLQVLAVLGKSGVGKTTLLNHLAAMNKSISYITQQPALIESLDVEQNIMLPLLSIYGRKAAKLLADDIMEKSGLSRLKHQKVKSLSGGQKQRVSLVRAFLYPANLLLMDEAFSGQDISTKISLYTLFKKLNDYHRRTVVMVTHNLEEIDLADRVIVLKGLPVYIAYDEKVENVKKEDVIFCFDETD